MANVANPGKIVGIKVSLTVLELTVATTTVPPVGNRGFDSAGRPPSDDPDVVPAEGLRPNDMLDDYMEGNGATGAPEDDPEGAEANPNKLPAFCPSTGAITPNSKKQNTDIAA